MTKWQITLADNKSIYVKGTTLRQAVHNWASKQRNGRTVECGLLVRVKQPSGIYGYWSGEKFLECLG